MPGNVVACKSEKVQLAELMILHSHTHTFWTTIDCMHVGRVITLFNPKTSALIQKRHFYNEKPNSETFGHSKNVFLH